MCDLSRDSLLLDLACSTGFSSRSVWSLTGVNAFGIDQSHHAVQEATKRAKRAGASGQLNYLLSNAVSLPFEDGTFTHILAGGCFGFIQERQEALKECRRVLAKDGLLAIATFYYRSRPPDALLSRVAQSIGYRPDPVRDLKYWRDFYLRESFVRIAQQGYDLHVQNSSAVTTAVESFVYENSESLRRYTPGVRAACFQRLNKIRLILNEHRRYQGYSVEVWKYT